MWKDHALQFLPVNQSFCATSSCHEHHPRKAIPNACLFPDHEVSSVLEAQRCRTCRIGHLMPYQSYRPYWPYWPHKNITMCMFADCTANELWAQLAALSILFATSSNASHCRYSMFWMFFLGIHGWIHFMLVCRPSVYFDKYGALFSVVSVARRRFMTIVDLTISYNIEVVVLLKTWTTVARYWLGVSVLWRMLMTVVLKNEQIAGVVNGLITNKSNNISPNMDEIEWMLRQTYVNSPLRSDGHPTQFLS